ncbi:MAG: type II toxin-antitoxin system prevent-host-death family antitoxin [Firmicutes bacterium]|nr:type II toxin-antitoxin system prevent-host-death family antitoxin [Bacillota bacterium]
MQITATELKLRLGYYLEHVSEEDIWISKNGKTIAKLVNPNVSAVDSISGILKDKIPESTDAQDLRDERILRYEIHD